MPPNLWEHGNGLLLSRQPSALTNASSRAWDASDVATNPDGFRTQADLEMRPWSTFKLLDPQKIGVRWNDLVLSIAASAEGSNRVAGGAGAPAESSGAINDGLRAVMEEVKQ